MTRYLASAPLSVFAKDDSDRDLLHRKVFKLLPDVAGGREAANALYRVDATRAGQYVLISSALPFKAGTALTAEYGDDAAAVRVREFDPSIGALEGDDVRFTVSVAAIRRTRIDGRVHETTIPAEDAEASIIDRLTGALGDIQTVTLTRGFYARKRAHAGQGNSRLAIDTLIGIAEVTDTAALRRLLENGVGRSKAFGAGLLTIQR